MHLPVDTVKELKECKAERATAASSLFPSQMKPLVENEQFVRQLLQILSFFKAQSRPNQKLITSLVAPQKLITYEQERQPAAAPMD